MRFGRTIAPNMKRIVHFGAGALGRGLVVPMLVESGCEVILADTNQEVIDCIKEKKCYVLTISDDETQPLKTIPIYDIVSPMSDEALLLRYVSECDIVTTSVRRENLIHVARVLARAWVQDTCNNKMVICCENVEHVGSYFKDILQQCAQHESEYQNLSRIKVPDTIVDRICAIGDDIADITSEVFHECSVDQDVVANTGFAYIPAVQNITSHFYRKRYLLNTYADTLAFIGKGRGLQYLYEVAKCDDIHDAIQPYVHLLQVLLQKQYGIFASEAAHWCATYRKRLSNASIPRSLDSVARGLWEKMTLSERFMCPLVELYERGIDIREGLATIHMIIKEANKSEGLSQTEIQARLKILWCTCPSGEELYHQYWNLV